MRELPYLCRYDFKFAHTSGRFTLITMSAACSRPDGPSLMSIDNDASMANASSSNDIHNEIEAYADIPDETIEETFERIQRTSSGHAAINSDKK